MGNLFSGIYIPFVSDLLNKIPSMVSEKENFITSVCTNYDDR